MIAIIKYNAGNSRSVQNAVLRLGLDSVITDDPKQIKQADHVIFPGVGEAGTAMEYLKNKGLNKIIPSLEQPVLGICLGLQLMCKYSEEGDTECLGIFNAVVKKFPPQKIVPHIGWNNSEQMEGSLFEEIKEKDHMYYLHSYYAEICSNTIAHCDYIVPFSAAIQKNNFYATQFHPEKSGKVGERILLNFLNL